MYTIDIVTWNEKEALYEYFLLKKKIFFDDEKWPILLNGNDENLAAPDEFDEGSTFLLLSHSVDGVIGIARYCILNRLFPHRDILAFRYEHLKQNFGPDMIATINSFAVKRSYRRSSEAKNSEKKYASDELWLRLRQELINSSISVVILTTDFGRGSKFFSRHGFYEIDSPQYLFGREKKYINMEIELN